MVVAFQFSVAVSQFVQQRKNEVQTDCSAAAADQFTIQFQFESDIDAEAVGDTMTALSFLSLLQKCRRRRRVRFSPFYPTKSLMVADLS